MSTFGIPQPFATDDDYAAGPDVGTPTKVDPDVAASGFVRGTAAAAQHQNYLWNAVNGALRPALTRVALCQRELTLPGTTIDDTAQFMAAACAEEGRPIVVAKAHTGGTFQVDDTPLFELADPVDTLLTQVRDAAVDLDTGRILVAGGGGSTRTARTDDDGATWTGASDPGVTIGQVIRDDVHSRFIAFAAGLNAIFTSIDGSGVWTSGVMPVDFVGIGLDSTGRLVAVQTGNEPDTYVSTNAGIGWTQTAAPAFDTGFNGSALSVNGRGGSAVMAVLRDAADDTLYVYTTIDGGVTWVERAQFDAPTGETYNGIWRVLCDCNNPEAFIVAGELSSGRTSVRLSADAGLSWSEAVYIAGQDVEGMAFAGGRLFTTRGAQLFASDGIGF